MMDIRLHLNRDLTTVSEITAVVTHVYPGLRPVNSPLPALVWRCTQLVRGEDLREDTGERMARFELEIWAADLAACLVIRDPLVDRYHGTEGYDFGGNAGIGEDPIDMGSSRILNEFDGGRVRDPYAVDEAVPLTLELELMWTEN